MTTTAATPTLAVIGDTSEAVDRLAKKCRALTLAAEWLDEHGIDLPFQPYITANTHRDHVELSFFVSHHVEGEQQQKAATAHLIRVIGGHWAKSDRDDRLDLEQRDDPRIQFFISVERAAVCTRVVTGTHEVTVPAVEAQPERVEVVEDVEWQCLPILAGAS